MAEIQITQVRSLIGCTRQQRRTLASLGLRRIRHSVTMPDRPEIRGMVSTVAHLVEVAYPGEAEVLDLEPGQRPKGEGNPPAGASVADEDAAQVEEERTEALAEPGDVQDLGDLVDHAPKLGSPGRPDRPKPKGSPVDPDAEPGGPGEPTDTQVMEVVDPELTGDEE